MVVSTSSYTPCCLPSSTIVQVEVRILLLATTERKDKDFVLLKARDVYFRVTKFLFRRTQVFVSHGYAPNRGATFDFAHELVHGLRITTAVVVFTTSFCCCCGCRCCMRLFLRAKDVRRFGAIPGHRNHGSFPQSLVVLVGVKGIGKTGGTGIDHVPNLLFDLKTRRYGGPNPGFRLPGILVRPLRHLVGQERTAAHFPRGLFLLFPVGTCIALELGHHHHVVGTIAAVTDDAVGIEFVARDEEMRKRIALAQGFDRAARIDDAGSVVIVRSSRLFWVVVVVVVVGSFFQIDEDSTKRGPRAVVDDTREDNPGIRSPLDRVQRHFFVKKLTRQDLDGIVVRVHVRYRKGDVRPRD
mmetsp:Transcript_15466/g.33387  ORF Transcript_15466/g.33387 Transcript_15466/m.33387 type:complete len:355 (-) Transcript_15466:1057-2121(-)